MHSVSRSVETALAGAANAKVKHYSSIDVRLTERNSGRWIVWLGRYTFDKETKVPNALLRRVRNPSPRVKDKCRAD